MNYIKQNVNLKRIQQRSPPQKNLVSSNSKVSDVMWHDDAQLVWKRSALFVFFEEMGISTWSWHGRDAVDAVIDAKSTIKTPEQVIGLENKKHFTWHLVKHLHNLILEMKK